MSDDKLDLTKLHIDQLHMNMKEYQLYSPPKPNWKLTFAEQPLTCFYIHAKKVPNKFQRWMIQKCFGIKWEKLV